MTDAGEKWYQATLCVWVRGQGSSDWIPMGPPRRLIEDVILDIRRNKEQLPSHYTDTKRGISVGGVGALVLWPNVHHLWISEEDFKTSSDL